MRLASERIKGGLSVLGVSIFIMSIIFTINFHSVETNNNYAKMAAGWTNKETKINNNSYAKTTATWTDKGLKVNNNNYAKIAASWTDKGPKGKNNSAIKL